MADERWREVISADQLRAARALLKLDQRQTAELTGLSLPTIQRMEASDGVIRGNVDSLMKLVSGLERAGVELLGPGSPSAGTGRGVRLREDAGKSRIKTAKISTKVKAAETLKRRSS